MALTSGTRGLTLLACVLALACGDEARTSSAGQTDSGASATGTATGTGTATVAETGAPTTTDGSASASQGETSTGDPPTTSVSATGTTTGSESSTGEPDSSTGSTTAPVDPCAGEMGGFDFSYLWIANTGQGSVSKINTTTMLEEARYYADPNPASASTSRTSVNIDGHCVVVSNRASYSLTKIAARFGTTVAAIAQANNIVNVNLIFVGQVLVIPGAAPIPNPTTGPAPATPAPQPIGAFEFGGRRFLLRRVAFPPNPPTEWFVIDLFENADKAAASPDALAQNLERALRRGVFDRQRLEEMTQRYASRATASLVSSALEASKA